MRTQNGCMQLLMTSKFFLGKKIHSPVTEL